MPFTTPKWTERQKGTSTDEHYLNIQRAGVEMDREGKYGAESILWTWPVLNDPTCNLHSQCSQHKSSAETLKYGISATQVWNVIPVQMMISLNLQPHNTTTHLNGSAYHFATLLKLSRCEKIYETLRKAHVLSATRALHMNLCVLVL